MNPTTLPFYLPLLTSVPHGEVDSAPSAPNKTAILLGRPTYTFASQSTTFHSPFVDGVNEDWASLDREFRKKLPDGCYTKRLAYRGMVMSCTGVQVLDGLEISDGERRKAVELLRRSRNGL